PPPPPPPRRVPPPPPPARGARGGAPRLVCHGDKTEGLRIGSWVAIEAVGNIYYFSHLGTLDRTRLFWRRAGRAGERMSAIAASLAKRAWKGRFRGEGS